MIASINPTTGEVMHQFETLSPAQIEAALDRACSAVKAWGREKISHRAALMLKAAEFLRKEKESLGRMMTEEMGKTLRSAIQEVEKCALGCQFFAEHAEEFLRDEDLSGTDSRAFVKFQPLGAILAVMPWNFPFWQVFRFAAPSLMAGNVALLKHASNVPRCALAIENVFRQAGFRGGVFQTLLVPSGAVPDLIADVRVAAVTLTGSVAAGSSVAALAGKYIKKSVLELGGSDPFIVMPTAPLDQAVETAVQARIINNGQSCIAAKRFIVHETIAPEFEMRFVRRMTALKVGDPMAPGTDIGPLATEEVRASLDEQVRETVKKGAKVLLGGNSIPGKGFFYSPTVLVDIPPGTPARDDELFGPVASLHRAKDLEHALQLANETPFGLGAAAWTNDPLERDAFIDGIHSGLVFINGMVASHPRLPFGGVKQSGYGRELSRQGMLEFVNTKTVVLEAEQR